MAINSSLRLILIFLSVPCLQWSVLHSVDAQSHEEEFTEELLLKPLPDHKVVAHFHFTSKVPPTQVYVNGQPKLVWDVVKKMWVSSSEDWKSPGVMGMEIKIPCNTSSTVLTVNFEKGFLQIDEYPPDVNQGFDLPSTHISFPSFQAGRSYLK